MKTNANTATARLINRHAVATLLGLRPFAFARMQSSLEARGFPPPVLTDDVFGTERWDARAIDLWIDRHMPGNLQTEQASMDFRSIMPSIENDLAARAAALPI